MSGDEATLDTGDSGSTPAAAAVENYEQRFKDTQTALHEKAQALKAEQELWEDEDALLARLGERYPDWLMGDDDSDMEDSTPTTQESTTPPRDPRLDEALPILEQLQAAEAERNYNTDLNKLLNGREVNEKAQRFIRAACREGGDNPKALENAVNEWFELFPVKEEPAEKKRVSHVIAAGKMTEEGQPDWSKMTDDEIDRYMAAEVVARAQNT